MASKLAAPRATSNQVEWPVGSMGVLAVLEGVQPLLMKYCVRPDANRRSVVAMAEAMKLLISLSLVSEGPSKALVNVGKNWRLAVVRAGPPAILFALQNFLLQFAYPRLDSLLFGVVGQTKVLFVALAGRLLLGKRLSNLQVGALGMLTGAALATWEPPQSSPAPKAISTNGAEAATRLTDSKGDSGASTMLCEQRRLSDAQLQRQLGLAAQIAANALSGLNATLVERALRGRDPLTFNVELALCGVLSTLVGSVLSLRSPSSGDSSLSCSELFVGWDATTALAPLAMALNGLVTGFVIKGGGGIAKAFASVGAILITSILRALVERRPLSRLQGFVALPLAASGVIIFSKFPAPSEH